MRRIIVFLISIPFLTNGQVHIQKFDSYNPTYKFEWSGFEVTNSYDCKVKFIEFAQENDLLQYEREALKMLNKNLRFQLKAVDINADGLADIIYQGPHMGEGLVIRIFLQDKTSFKKVFSSSQGIVTVDWTGEKLSKLYIRDWGCCADPNLSSKVYEVTYDGNTPKFSLLWHLIEIRSFITKPKHYMEPKRFEVENEMYTLRANPWIDNDTENEFLGLTGNSIGILHKGFKGTAYATSTDETGRVWWYVMIDRQFEVSEAYINYEFYDFKPFLLGWISSRYLKEL